MPAVDALAAGLVASRAVAVGALFVIFGAIAFFGYYVTR